MKDLITIIGLILGAIIGFALIVGILAAPFLFALKMLISAFS